MDVEKTSSLRSKQSNGIEGENHEGDNQGRGDADRNSSKVAHTLTACCRCRQRKTRCDAGLPRCSPCERSNAVCEYYDSAKGKNIPRTYVIYLQNRVQNLEQELLQLEDDQSIQPDAEILMRGAGHVRFKENDESRFLGPSSGIAMTRLVMELAKENSDTKSIKEIVPAQKAQEIKERFARESSKPTSKVYPLISSVAAPNLPTRELTDRLVENFNKKAQYLLPVLHEPSFQEAVRDVYLGCSDPYKNFTLRMVIAISMQKLDTQFAGLADSYYLAALPFLENAIRPMDLNTLQCFALIAEYSMITPTRTASYWVVGLATRLCQELGMADEATITRRPSGIPYSILETDLRRRLFWIIISFEFGLAHSLGRPSAFAISHEHINVEFFLPVDDQFITPSRVLSGAPHSTKKLIAIHFLKMRPLQAEIRRKLYLKKRNKPNDDQDPWFRQMEGKLNDWLENSPKNDEGSGLSKVWFKVRYNTMIVFLYRPSPQVPEPSLRAATLCFEASEYNFLAQRDQISKKSVDLTWIFTQSLFMALNTLLWTLSYPEIRKQHSREEVELCLRTAQEALFLASERWPGVESALELYHTLIHACLKAYDGNSDKSYVVGSPSNRPVPGSPQDLATPPALSTPSTVHSTMSSLRNGPDSDLESASGSIGKKDPLMYLDAYPSPPQTVSIRPTSQQAAYLQDYMGSSLPYSGSLSYQSIAFNPSSFDNPLPSPLEYGSRPGEPLIASFYDHNLYQGSPGEQYAQHIHNPYVPQEPLDSLNLQQQSELMSTLERQGFDDAMDITQQPSLFSSNISLLS